MTMSNAAEETSRPNAAEPRRKRYLVDPRFQLKYAMLFFAAGVVAAAGVGLLAYLSLHDAYQDLVNAGFQQSSELIANLEGRLRQLGILIAALLGFFAFACLLVGVLLTHRIAGPLEKLGHAMESAAEGDASVRVQFRRRDEFQRLAHAFNRLMEKR